MKHTHRCLLLYTGIALGGGAAGYVIWACTSAFLPLANVTTSSELLPSDPRYGEVICGPASLALALQRLGLNCSAAHVASRCKVTPQGVDLIELERFARTNEQIEARTQKMSWDVLRGVNGVAVLFVRGDHYVAADPRESPNNGINCDTLRIYEPEKPAQWCRWALERIPPVGASKGTRGCENSLMVVPMVSFGARNVPFHRPWTRWALWYLLLPFHGFQADSCAR